jgi:hypothetical protein
MRRLKVRPVKQLCLHAGMTLLMIGVLLCNDDTADFPFKAWVVVQFSSNMEWRWCL